MDGLLSLEHPGRILSADDILSPYIYVFYAAFLVSFFFTPVMRAIAVYYGIIDQPDRIRKMHSEPVAYLGGIAVFLGWMAGLAISQFSHMHHQELVSQHLRMPYSIVIGASVVVLLGLWDDLKDRLRDRATSLQLEQQQKLCIARLLPVKPEVILMDEPCSALDVEGTRAIEELMLTLRGRYTIVIVTHNMAQARRASDECIFMLLGEVIEHSRTEDLFLHPREPRTAEYIDTVLARITIVGAIYLALVAILPEFLITGFKVAPIPFIGETLDANLPNWFTQGLGVPFFFGGTTLLIVVGVAMDTVNQVESQLIMRHYDGFMKKTRIRGRRG